MKNVSIAVEEEIKTHILQNIYAKHRAIVQWYYNIQNCAALFVPPYVKTDGPQRMQSDSRYGFLKGNSKEDWIKLGVEFLSQEKFEKIDAKRNWIIQSLKNVNGITCNVQRGYVAMAINKNMEINLWPYIPSINEDVLTYNDYYNYVCFRCP